jgi:hypothetical protein
LIQPKRSQTEKAERRPEKKVRKQDRVEHQKLETGNWKPKLTAESSPKNKEFRGDVKPVPLSQ